MVQKMEFLGRDKNFLQKIEQKLFKNPYVFFWT